MNPLGIVHRGWAMTLIDSAAGRAAHTLLPAGASYATIETKANFSRSPKTLVGCALKDAPLAAGGASSPAKRVVDANGRLLGHGTSTLMVLEGGGAPNMVRPPR